MIIFDQKICQINSWKLNFDKEIIDFDHLKKNSPAALKNPKLATPTLKILKIWGFLE